MPTNETTVNQGYAKVHSDNSLAHDVERLRQFADQLDTSVSNLEAQLALVPGQGHSHEVTDINGLTTLLNAKADNSALPTALNDFTDVNVSGAADATFLYKLGGVWQATTISANMIVGGTIDQARLPTYLAQSAIDAKAEDATAAKIDVTNTFSKTQKGEVETVQFSANMALDFSIEPVKKIIATGDFTLDPPTGISANAPYTIHILMDATGGHTASYNTIFSFGEQDPFDTSTLGANEVVTLYVQSNHDGTKLHVSAFKEV